MSLSLPPDFQRIVTILLANRVNLITAYGLYYWDMLALFPLEYRHVWKSRWTPIKVFYLLNRYVTLVIGWANAYVTMNHIPLDLCKRMTAVQPIFSAVIILLCGCISTLRVYAIWNHDKRVLTVVCGWLACCITLMVYLATQQQELILPTFLTDAAGFTNCLSTRTDSKSYYEILLWTPPLSFDALVLSLTVFRYFALRRRTGGMDIPIMRKIVNIHIVYFALIASMNAINVGFFAQSDPALRPSNAVMTLTLTSMMSSRLVLALLAPAPPPFVKHSAKPSRTSSRVRSNT